uniref:Uncharacterized protein n=1 Tax=Anopheles atroparvus TaxID=41427 RepID=A0A182IW28_ANOAO
MARLMFILLCSFAFASAVSGAYGAQKPSGHHQHQAPVQHHHPSPVHTQPHVNHESVHHGHYAKVHYPAEPVVAHPKVPEKHDHPASSHQPNKGYHH